MDTLSPRSFPDLARAMRPWAFGAAFAVAVGFHFLFSHAPTSWSLALFTLIITGGIIFMTQESHGLRNKWALWFLVPLLSACLSVSLYSSDVIKGLSFLMIAGSLAALAYWLTAPPVHWRKGVHLWKGALFLQAALPFRQYHLLFTTAEGERRVNTKFLVQIILGLLVAGPVLLIFMALFLEGDKYFDSVVNGWISLDFMGETIVRLIFDGLVMLFGAGFFWRIARRSREEAEAKEPVAPFQEIIATRSFLFAIAALFLLFAGFQIFYLFQGSSYFLDQGRTYAQYAVSGYQQLCAAAAFAFVILLVVYRLTHMQDRWVRWASGVIAVTSMISTLSAAKRLWLYVDAYGLTLSRSWGMQFLVLVILLFSVLLIAGVKRWNIHQLITAGSALTLGLVSIAMLFNQEAFVARYNLSRHAEQKGPGLDLYYLVYQLSSDAVPTIANALRSPSWNTGRVRITPSYTTEERETDIRNGLGLTDGQTARERVLGYWLESKLPYLQQEDVRFLTLSDLRAERAVQTIPELR